MIRIRYRGSNELSPGLHAAAEQRGRRTTVYLLSGLTAAERRSALRRLRLTARMGHCPRLPAGQLAFALLMDRIRTGIGRAGAVFRLHPAGSTVPIMVLSGGAIAFLLFSTVSIHVLRPQTANQSDAGPPAASASAISLGGGPQGLGAGPGGRGGSANPHGSFDPGRGSRGADTRQLTQPSGAPVTTSPALAAGGAGAADGTGSGGALAGSTGSVTTGSGSTGSGSTGSGSSAANSDSSSKSSGGGTTLSGSANQTSVTPTQTTPATSGAAPAPAATVPAATPTTAGSGSSSGSSNGVCVNVGPLGVCLNI
jgi:hypothetical protein